MITPLIDLYRCPEKLINLGLAGDPSLASGYFSFGQNAVCFGRSSVASSKPDGNGLHDFAEHVTWDGSTLWLPFDPSDVVDNLRRERYIADGHGGKPLLSSGGPLERIYYAFRPLLCVSVRKYLQRMFLRNWDSLSFPKWPVDTTVERLIEKLLFLSMKAQGIEKVPFIWFWPEGAASCAVITHDVETQAGCELVPHLMKIDEVFGIRASFQVIPEGPYKISKALVDEIRSRGFELNIQDLSHDGNLFDDRDKFLLRAKKISDYVHEYRAQGFRSGRMYRNADWYEVLDVSYDMSIPNVAHLDPQRGGCCTVFPYFIGKILELPLTTTQDYSLFHILGDYSLDLWQKQIRLITANHGLASFIIHPDYSMEHAALNVYKSLLRYLADLREGGKLWIALPGEVNRWWRERSEMRLVLENGEWRIEGYGKERATIAYATIAGDGICYAFDRSACSAQAHHGGKTVSLEDSNDSAEVGAPGASVINS